MLTNRLPSPRPPCRPVAARLAGLAFAFCAATGAAAAPPPGVTAVREVEGVAEYRLANGLQVLLIPDPSRPTITVNVTYRVGSRMESYGETGMAHLLEHLMFKTSPTHPNVGAELSKRGMQFNGTTDRDRTNYYESFPADPLQLDWALRMEAERMTRAAISRKDLDTEMTVVRNEMESGENSPVRILLQKTDGVAYQWHAYGKDTIGARTDVENVNIPHLQAFYRKYYQPDNATLIVAGAFDAGHALAEIAQGFGKLPRPTRALEPSWTLDPVQDGEREVTLRRSGGQQAVFVAYHTPPAAHPDWAALQVVAQVLGDPPNGRLHKRLVEAGLANEAYAWLRETAEPGLIHFGFVAKTGEPLAAVEQKLLATIEGIAAEPVTAEELQRAQLQGANGYEELLADPQRLCVTLSASIAAGDWRLLFLNRDRQAALTLAQVNAAAARWLKSTNRTLGRFLPTDVADRAPAPARADVAAQLKDFTPKVAVAAVAAFDTTPANIDRRTERYALPSGLQVALLPKPSRGGMVEVSLGLRMGTLESLQGKSMAAQLVGTMLATGTLRHDRKALADAFDALKTQWQVSGSVLDGASAGLTTRREQLVPALTLLAEVLREPAFPQSELEQVIRQQLTGLEQAATDPGALAQQALAIATERYPLGDPRHRATLAETGAALKAIKREDLVAFHQAFYGAGHGEIAIVGDFDPAAAKAAIATLFGQWPAKEAWARIPRPAADRPGNRVQTLVKDKPNAFAIGALSIPVKDSDPDYVPLRLAAHVLGAGGFDSRLLTRLRQKEGLSYGAGAQYWASSFDAAGAMSFYAIFAPENRARIEQGFAEELARFVKDGITADELASAKKAMQSATVQMRASDGNLASVWESHLERGRTFQTDAAEDAAIASLTQAQVNDAIRRRIDPARIVWSLAGDFDKPAPAAGTAPAAGAK